MSTKDPYLILGVSEGAPDFVIQAAYRACLKQFHPDHYREADAAARTADILEAYRVLSDPKLRAQLDERRRAKAAPRPSAGPQPPKGGTATACPSPKQLEKTAAGGRGWLAAGVLVAGSALWLFLAQTDAGADLDAGYIDTVEMPAEDAAYTDEDGALDAAVAADAAAADAMAAAGEAEAAITAAASTTSELPYQASPVQFSTIEAASRKFAQTLRTSGMSGARQFSQRCHAQQEAEPSWDGLDYCAAFDFAAAALDAEMVGSAYGRNSYFAFQSENQDSYYPTRVNGYSRLQTVQTAARQTLADAASELAPEPRARPKAPPAPKVMIPAAVDSAPDSWRSEESADAMVAGVAARAAAAQSSGKGE